MLNPTSTITERAVWRWTESGYISVRFTYLMMHNTGIISIYHRRLWWIKTANKVKNFRSNTRSAGQKELYIASMLSTLKDCNVQVLETGQHLFVECQFSAALWLVLQHNLTYWCCLTRQYNKYGSLHNIQGLEFTGFNGTPLHGNFLAHPEKKKQEAVWRSKEIIWILLLQHITMDLLSWLEHC
jgi:hypothetical protein